MEGQSLVLVINTLVDGKPNTNLGSVNSLLSDIDKELLSGNEVEKQIQI